MLLTRTAGGDLKKMRHARMDTAGRPDRGGYTDELEFTRLLLTSAETRQRVQAFLAGSAESSTQTKSGAAR